ncbi:MAG: hypothetical protein VYC39_02880 [Myxococcota bacterium]|nr:hypothetical protein [Myxococcota bacterium]
MLHTTREVPDRRINVSLPELLDGLTLTRQSLEQRNENGAVSSLLELISNAEYWLSYETDNFDPNLMYCPSPLRELGVGITLRFGHSLEGLLAIEDIESCREEIMSTLPQDFHEGFQNGLDTLTRVVEVRAQVPSLEEQGYRRYEESKKLSIHALRASGRATIKLNGRHVTSQKSTFLVGESIRISAVDSQNRPIDLPEVSNRTGSPILSKDSLDGDSRECIFTIPGIYRVSVPSRAEGGHKLFIR